GGAALGRSGRGPRPGGRRPAGRAGARAGGGGGRAGVRDRRAQGHGGAARAARGGAPAGVVTRPYHTGTTKRFSHVELKSPPTMTSAIGCSISPPARPPSSRSGSSAMPVTSAV